jgi:hypothetical protein
LRLSEPRAQLRRLVEHAEQVLDVMPDLMRDDVGRGEVAPPPGGAAADRP